MIIEVEKLVQSLLREKCLLLVQRRWRFVLHPKLKKERPDTAGIKTVMMPSKMGITS